MKRKKVKDINSFSNRLAKLADDYQNALNKKAQEFEKTLHAPSAQKKKS